MGVWRRLRRTTAGNGGEGDEREAGVGVEQLCLEVAPSILIDFICAHVSERASKPRRGKRERVKGGGIGRIERQTEAMRGYRWNKETASSASE